MILVVFMIVTDANDNEWNCKIAFNVLKMLKMANEQLLWFCLWISFDYLNDGDDNCDTS